MFMDTLQLAMLTAISMPLLHTEKEHKSYERGQREKVQNNHMMQ